MNSRPQHNSKYIVLQQHLGAHKSTLQIRHDVVQLMLSSVLLGRVKREQGLIKLANTPRKIRNVHNSITTGNSTRGGAYNNIIAKCDATQVPGLGHPKQEGFSPQGSIRPAGDEAHCSCHVSDRGSGLESSESRRASIYKSCLVAAYANVLTTGRGMM